MTSRSTFPVQPKLQAPSSAHPSPDEWGNRCWYVAELAAHSVDHYLLLLRASPADANAQHAWKRCCDDVRATMRAFVTIVPCGKCKLHYQQYLDENPLPDDASLQRHGGQILRVWIWRIQSSIQERQRREQEEMLREILRNLVDWGDIRNRPDLCLAHVRERIANVHKAMKNSNPSREQVKAFEKQLTAYSSLSESEADAVAFVETKFYENMDAAIALLEQLNTFGKSQAQPTDRYIGEREHLYRIRAELEERQQWYLSSSIQEKKKKMVVALSTLDQLHCATKEDKTLENARQLLQNTLEDGSNAFYSQQRIQKIIEAIDAEIAQKSLVRWKIQENDILRRDYAKRSGDWKSLLQ